ncbi:visual pigment-like receptor peropsin isoform X2 [Struthio camelus]|uniref:visual pigment-like receptor peropsin isoform X2 n=1 Tax=Struthio camelus TaxID=8801 RepID=UPI003603C7E5
MLLNVCYSLLPLYRKSQVQQSNPLVPWALTKSKCKFSNWNFSLSWTSFVFMELHLIKIKLVRDLDTTTGCTLFCMHIAGLTASFVKFPFFCVPAGVISIFSNIVVLCIFVKYKELRTATNAIIINLAFTDIGVSGIGYPMSAASDLHGSWKFGYTGCQIYAALNIFFGMASIGLLTVVAVDRYLTICRPDIGRRMTTCNYATLIIVAWINAVFWASMPTVGWASYAPDPTGATCTVNWRKNDASFVSYTMSVIAVNFVIPLTVMFYCYYNVSRTMKQYATNNCLESINIDWSDQVDVTKVSEGNPGNGAMSEKTGDNYKQCLAHECVSECIDIIELISFAWIC